jgi:hypothetical protein
VPNFNFGLCGFNITPYMELIKMYRFPQKERAQLKEQRRLVQGTDFIKTDSFGVRHF